jgi:hypothetical protein
LRCTGLTEFIGGQDGTPRGLMYPNKLRFAPRVAIAHHIDRAGLVVRAAHGIFYTPFDLNKVVSQIAELRQATRIVIRMLRSDAKETVNKLALPYDVSLV